MISRILVLAGGFSGAVGLSQFPEFSQQYAQRLGGAVDELQGFVSEFDADAASVGLGRDEALTQLAAGGELGAARAETMANTINRYERLRAAQNTLESAGPFSRAYNVAQFNDREIAQAALADFKPAVPVTFEGAVFAIGGLLSGSALVSLVLSLLRLPFRRRKAAEGSA